MARGARDGRLASTAPTASATVELRFGFRAAAAQAPGRYIAPLAFEVVAPAA